MLYYIYIYIYIYCVCVCVCVCVCSVKLNDPPTNKKVALAASVCTSSDALKSLATDERLRYMPLAHELT